MAEDKTEAPTARRRADARKKGQVAKSMEINTALVMLVSFWVINATGAQSVKSLRSLMEQSFNKLATIELTPSTVQTGGITVGWIMIQIIAPLVLAVLVTGVVANVAQTGFMVSEQAITPNFSKLNPINGFKRMFALHAVVDLLKSMAKITIIGMVVYGMLRDNVMVMLAASQTSLTSALGNLVQIIIMVGTKVATILLVLAAADYLYQRYEFEKNLKMTKEEVRQEMKNMENPQIKAKIRQRQRQMAMSRMMAAVPKADVVITNPTHYAVALQYDRKKMAAPTLVAKGQLLVAQRIKDLAQEHHVPIVENKPLARNLFSTVEIGQIIPAEMFQAVAEVLAFVYRLKSGKNHKR